MKEKTAVEWLVEQLKSTRKKYMGFKNIDIDYQEIINQAKAMEKEQITAAFENFDFNLNDGEQYYNETFKSE